MTGIGSHWYIGKTTKGLPLLIKQTLSKKAQEKIIKLKGNYTLITVIGMIGNYNYIVTSLSELIQ